MRAGTARIYSARAWAWACFDFSTTVFSMNVVSRFGPLWLLEELGGQDWHVMTAVVASMLFATVVNLLLAPLSDALGQRAIFVRVFGLLCVVATAVLGLPLGVWPAVVLLALANLGNQSASVFWMAMLGEVSRRESLGRVSGLAVMLSYIGSITGLLLAQPFFRATGSGAAVFVPTALLFLVFALPQLLFVHDTGPRVGVEGAGALRGTWREWGALVRRLWQQRHLRLFIIALLLYMDVHATVTLYMAVYAKQAIGLDPARVVWGLDQITLFFVVSTLFAVAGGWGFGQLADRFDKVRLLRVVLLCWAVALAVATFTPVRWLFWLIGPLVGAGMGGVWSLSRALLIEYSQPEERTKLFAIFGLLGRAAGITGPLTWTLFLWLADQFAILAPHRYRVAIGSLLVELLVALWLVHRLRQVRRLRPD